MRKIGKWFFKVWRAIRNFVLRVVVMIKKITKKKKLRIYKIIASSSPSMIGATFVGQPKLGKQIVMLKAKGYLTLEPISVSKFAKGNRFVVYGKYNRVTAKRIR